MQTEAREWSYGGDAGRMPKESGPWEPYAGKSLLIRLMAEKLLSSLRLTENRDRPASGDDSPSAPDGHRRNRQHDPGDFSIPYRFHNLFHIPPNRML